MRTRARVFCAASRTARSWLALSAPGFSTSTCLPARTAASVSGASEALGVATITAWTSGSAKTAAAALLIDPTANLYFDGHNDQWFVAYFGEYFRQHLHLPAVFNSAAAVGMPQPIFYGAVFYPVLGLISAVTGAALALRIAIGA